MSSRALPASKAKAQFSELLHDVERGDRVTITRHGRPVVDMQPSQPASPAENRDGLDELIASIRERRARHVENPITTEEILQWRDEGRRF